MIRKIYKIFKLKKEYHSTYSTAYIFETAFGSLDEEQTKEQCEQVIENIGISGEQYAIVEVWEKGRE